ncbi:unnamed protein product [Arctia plantaginis]|uniref:Uncharacterized protein n=1 Tax=Arctia plantaginis TaxID=874455 RepID=A0A8S1B9B0_ARCPL|nr:unnamed protein product [Arctia plantaginis]
MIASYDSFICRCVTNSNIAICHQRCVVPMSTTLSNGEFSKVVLTTWWRSTAPEFYFRPRQGDQYVSGNELLTSSSELGRRASATTPTPSVHPCHTPF